MNKRSKISLLIALAAAAFMLLAACAPADIPDQPTAGGSAAPAKESGAAAPSAESKASLAQLVAKDHTGKQYDASVFTGHKLTMINVWGTYCGPCLKEMPALAELNREMADRGVQIIGAVADVGFKGDITELEKKAIDDIIADTKADYPHLVPAAGTNLNELILSGAYALPTSVFVDENGNVLSIEVGSRDKADWQKVIEAILASVADNADDKKGAKAAPSSAPVDPATLFDGGFSAKTPFGASVGDEIIGSTDYVLAMVWDAADAAGSTERLKMLETLAQKNDDISVIGIVTSGTADQAAALAKIAPSAKQIMADGNVRAYFAGHEGSCYAVAPWGSVYAGPTDPSADKAAVQAFVEESYDNMYKGCCG